MSKSRVLFLCTGNSARSQMAEGLVNHLMGETWEASSAGTDPTGKVHPMAVEVMQEIDVDITAQTSKNVSKFKDINFDLVLTVCDNAAETCPLWFGPGQVMHISFPDPAAVEGSDEEKLEVFRNTRDSLKERIEAALRDYERGTQPRGTSTREGFDWDLVRLKDGAIKLGNAVKQALTGAVDSLGKQNLDRAREIIAYDQEINRQRHAIEDFALELIATQQPVASDLRLIAAVLDVSGDLERMGDYAKGIARITLMLGENPTITPPESLTVMNDKVCDMISEALDAFARRDVEKAWKIPEQDDEVDDLYNTIYRQMLDLILADTDNIDAANYLTWAAHNLERAADRVANICERVIFTTTGQVVSLDKDEEYLNSK